MGCLACPGDDWNDLQNLTYTDHQYAEVSLTTYPQCFQATCYYSRTLYAYDFGFTIPAGATVAGVVAEVLQLSSTTSGVSDTLVQLYTGSPVGVNHASPTSWTQNPQNVIYGDSTDTWGYTLTPDSVNNSNFGIAIMVLNRDSTGTGAIASIDHITMTVYYRVQTGIFSQTRNKNSIIAHYNANTSSLEIFKGPGKMSNVHVINSCGEIIYADRQDMDLREKRSIRLPIINKGIYLLDAEVNGSRFSTQFIVE